VQAYRLYPSDKVLLNLALSEVKSARYVDGLVHLRLYEARAHVQPGHPKYPIVHEYMARAALHTGRIVVDAPMGAEVLVDGVSVGRMPVDPQDVSPGTHAVEAAGQRQEVVVRVESSVSAHFLPAFLPTVATPPRPAPSTERTEWKTADTSAAAPPLPPAPNTAVRDVVRWTTSGVAVAGFGVWIGFVIDADSRARSIDAFRTGHPGACANMQSAACTTTQSMSQGYDTSVAVSEVALVVGGLATAAAVASWTLWPKSESVQVSPSVGSRSATVEVHGRF